MSGAPSGARAWGQEIAMVGERLALRGGRASLTVVIPWFFEPRRGAGGTWCSVRRPHSPLPDSQFGRGVCSVKRLSFPLAELNTGGGLARVPPFLHRLPPWARDSHQRGYPGLPQGSSPRGGGGGLEVCASEVSSLRSAISPKEGVYLGFGCLRSFPRLPRIIDLHPERGSRDEKSG